MAMKPAAETEIKTLTGLRGLAAMMVATYHFIPVGLQSSPGPKAFLNHGYLCVDMFFVLSGFVMAYVYGRMFDRTASWGNYGSFLVRRIARVYPIYLVTTLFYFFLYYFGLTRHVDVIPNLIGTLALNVTMTQTWIGFYSLNSPAWSISVEWAAYLLFPALVSVTLFGSRRLAIAAGTLSLLGLVVLAYGLPASVTGVENGPLDLYRPAGLVLVRCITEFCFGLLTYRVAVHPSVRGWAGSMPFTAAAWAAFVVLMSIPRTDVLIVMTYPLLLLTLVHGSGLVARFFTSRVVYTLGILSYSIYLLHWRFVGVPGFLAAKLPAYGVGNAVGVAMAYAATIGLAALAYRFIEKPSRNAIRGFTERRTDRAAARAATSAAPNP